MSIVLSAGSKKSRSARTDSMRLCLSDEVSGFTVGCTHHSVRVASKVDLSFDVEESKLRV